MVWGEKRFKEIANIYLTLIAKFFEVHKIKEVVCTDTKEHFFDRIEIDKNGKLRVFENGSIWDTIRLNSTCDYAKCLSNMEHDLYLQERDGKHDKFTFYFTNDYKKPILLC